MTELFESAIAHATARVPTASPGQSVQEVRGSLSGHSFDYASAVAVVDGPRFVGLVPIERLLEAGPGEDVSGIMDPDCPVVGPEVDQELAAWEMVRRDEPSLAVVDADGNFGGLVSARRMLAVMLAEHDEDLARLGGYLAGSTRARTAAEERVGRRLLHRLPWLVIGLVGAMASAVIVGAFEQQLDAKVLLAFFLPAVVYMADAVGTQTETVLIRGLSADIRIPVVLRREAASGLMIGVVIAVCFFPFALLGWGDRDAALAVSIALFASCSIATVVAIALPLALQRLGRDPAFGSGPLATIVQDLLSIAVYLAIAVPIAS